MNADNTSGLRDALDFVNRQPCRCMSIAQLGERDYCDRCQSVKNLRALLARTEAGPSLLCQSDACAHKGTVHNFCTPRTEAGADGAVAYRVRRGNGSWGIPHEYLPGSPATIAALCDEGCEVQYLHPQDASGDAKFSAAELESLAKCVLASVTPGGFHIPEGWNCLLDKLAAMQAKEAK